jgi:hypothetical protein
LEAALANFTSQVARASYIEGIDDALDATYHESKSEIEEIRKELLEE